jgi:hypothetical protein
MPGGDRVAAEAGGKQRAIASIDDILSRKEEVRR